MTQKCKDIFFTDRLPRPFNKIVLNQDLEKLLEIDTIHVENKNTIKPNILAKKAKSPVPPFCSQIKKIIVKQNVPETEHSKDKAKILAVTEASDQNDMSKFHQVLTRNEGFVCQFAKSDFQNHELENSMLVNLEKFIHTSAPINRFSWQLMRKLNMTASPHPQQFLKTSGHEILICGSLGGNTKTLPELKTTIKKIKKVKKPEVVVEKKPKSFLKVPKRLLLSHINYNLKPGPLSKKPLLNQSQRNLGDIQIVKLPQVEVEISPMIGTHLDTNVCKRLKYVRDKDGLIDAPWAKFATSIIRPQTPDQPKTSHTFTIPYENNRSRVLMRKDSDTNVKSNVLKRKRDDSSYSLIDSELPFLDNFKSEDDVEATVKQILSDLLRCICIEEIQDDVLTYDPEFEEKSDVLSKDTPNNIKKKKMGKKYVNELKKLDVTVIDIDLNQSELKKDCDEDFCKSGCVCSSLKTNYFINNHCGLPECMFDCKCNLDDSVIQLCRSEEPVDISQSAVANLQHQMNRYLSKEEKKFQRTVIRSNNQTILLGARRRGVRLPKRFEDYCNESYKDDTVDEKLVNLNPVVVLHKLPVVSCEPWCMVHQLYRCFCKGAFVEGSKFNYSNIHDEEQCLHILENAVSLRRDEDSSVAHVNSCARTTYDPYLTERSSTKTMSYIVRNEKVFEAEEKNIARKKLLLRKIHDCATDLSFKTNMSFQTEKRIVNIDSSKILKQNNSLLKFVENKASLKQKETEHYKDIIERNSGMVSKVIVSKISFPFKPPKEDDFNVKSLHTLITEYVLQEIFIWVTTQPPFKQYITLKNNIDCPRNCINIHLAPENVIKLHPPFMKEIVSLSHSKDTYVLLIGKSFAWEIVGTTKAKVPDPNLNNKIIERPSEPLKKNWFMLFVGDDFGMIKVESKQFAISRSSVLQAVEGAQKRKRFIRFLSKMMPQEKPFNFGLYASPFEQEKCAFLGPYESDTNPDIDIVHHDPDAKQSTGMWLDTKTHHRLHGILSFLSTQRNKNAVEPVTSPKFHIFPEIKNHKFESNLNTILNASSLKPSSKNFENKPSFNKRKIILAERTSNCKFLQEKIISDSSLSSNGTHEESDLNSAQSYCDEDVIFMPNERDVVEISDSE